MVNDHKKVQSGSLNDQNRLQVLSFLLLILIRVLIGLLPHSGENHPPIGGDYEAQRHWMEVSLHLPIRDWYSQTDSNDLMYWGLDYPPLSAYASYAIGYFAPPSLVRFRNSTLSAARIAASSNLPYVDGDELKLSGGVVTEHRFLTLSRHKWFMRASVIASDVLIYFPAVFLLVRATKLLGGFDADVTSYKRSLLSWGLLPPLLFIDHGHFQYNGVMLGLTMASVASLGQDRFMLSAALFSLALNFKQMALYFAPVFFVYIISASLSGGFQFVVFGLSRRSFHRSSLVQSLFAVLAVGVVVAAVFAALWAPFCLFALPGGLEAMNSDSCINGLTVVLRRIFPFARNIFEDKVANIWCVLEPMIGFRKRLLANPEETPRVALISTCITLLLIVPSLSFLFMMKRMSIDGVALTDTSGHIQTKAPRVERNPDPSRAVLRNREKKRKASISRAFVLSLATSTTSRRRTSLRVSQFAGTQNEIADVDTDKEESAESLTQESITPFIDLNERPSSRPSSFSSSSPSSFPAHTPLRMFEALLLSLFICSISFFLASFQVHEKSILLPLVPLHALYHKLPLLSLWFTSMSFFSLWPLFLKDGLFSIIMTSILVVFVTNALNYPRAQIGNSLWPWHRALSEPPFRLIEEASSINFVFERLFGIKMPINAYKLHSYLFRFALSMVLLSAALGCAAFFLPAPLSKPDLYPYLTALLSASNFGVIYMIATAVQYKWLVLSR